MTTPTTEPALLYTGDTWAWTKSLADYPASSGWVLKYVFSNSDKRFDITGSASGDDHAISVSATESAKKTAGQYAWQAYVESGAERYTVGTGQTEIRIGLAAIDGPSDQRSQARTAMDAALAALAQYTATQGAVSEYEIDGRRMKFRSVKELRELVNYWSRQVQMEIDAENIRKGLGTSRKVFTRFGS